MTDATNTDDPILSAKALAAAIEAENAGRINKLIAQGAHPLSIQIGIVQTGLEEIINLIPIPPLLRAQFEVACETAIAAYLDKVQSELTRQRLGVGVPSVGDVSRLLER